MTVNICWDDESETIMRMDFIGEWTWDEVHQAIKQMRTLIGEVHDDFGFIIDVSQGVGAPSPFLSQLRSVMQNRSPAMGLTVLVGLNDAILIFWKIFVQAYGRLIRQDRYAVARTAEEARMIIAAKAALSQKAS